METGQDWTPTVGALVGGRFRVGRRLGAGALGVVYKCYDEFESVDVAVKFALAGGRPDSLRAEYARLYRMAHPAFPAAIAFGALPLDGRAFFAMEYVDGVPWNEAVVGVDRARLVSWLAAIARALGHLHAHGQVHGDLAPPNVLVSPRPDSLPKLLDLGMTSGSGPGVLSYAAPERLAGGPPTQASDWFSFGMLAAFAVLGVHPAPSYPKTIPRDGFDVPARSGLGRALGDWIRRLLALAPEQRMQGASTVLAALGAAADVAVAHVTASEVAIRARSLEWVPSPASIGDASELVERWNDAASAQVVWVRGGPGTGRTRTLRDWAERLELHGVRVIPVRGRPFDAGLELALGVLERMQAGLDAPPALPALAEGLLRRWRGESEDGDRTHALDVDPRRERAQRVDALAQAIVDCMQARAMALLVDDADVVDAESREVLDAVVRQLRVGAAPAARCFVVLAGSSVWLEDDAYRPIDLGGWDADAVALFLRRLFPGRRIGRDVVDVLLAWSGGVPLVAIRVVETLFANGALWVGEHQVGIDERAASELRPEADEAAGGRLGVARWFAERVQEAAETERPVLAALAILDADCPVDWIADLTDLPADIVRLSLAALVREGLVIRVDSAVGARVGLAAPVERSLVLDAWEPARLRELHRRAADLYSAAGESVEQRAGACRHRLLAADNPTPDLVHSVVESADDLAQRGAYGQALRLIDSARNALTERALPLPHGLLLVEGRAALALAQFDRAEAAFRSAQNAAGEGLDTATATARLGLVYLRRGDYTQAVEQLGRAIDGLQGAGGSADAARLAHMASWHAQALLSSGRYDDAVSECQAALDWLDTSSPTGEPLVRGRLGQTRGLAAFYSSDLDTALAWFRKAAAYFDEARSEVDAANCLTSAALVYHRRDEYEAALELYSEALVTFERLGDRARQWATWMNLGVVYQEQGDYGRALDAYRRSYTLASAIGDRGGVTRNANNLGNALRSIGDLEAANGYVQESLASARQTGDRFIEGYNLVLLGELARLEGALERASDLFDEAESLFSELGCANEAIEVQVERARLHLARGDFADAARVARLAAMQARENGVRDLLAASLLVAAEADRRRPDGDIEAAGQRLAEADSVARQMGHRELLWQCLMERARLARDSQQLAEACAFGLEALEVMRELIDRLPSELRRTYESSSPRRGALAELKWVDALARFDVSHQGRVAQSPTLAKLLEINKRLSAEHDLDRLLEFIMDSAILLTGAERGFLLLRDTDPSAELQIKVARNFDRENIRNVKFKISRSIAERVMEQGDPIITLDAMEDERYREYLSIHSLRLRSILCVPLQRGGRSAGVLYLDNRFQVSAFDEDDLQFMEAFADQAAIAIGNAQLMEDKERARQALERSREQVAALNAQLEEKLLATTLALDETRTRVARQQRQLEGKHRYDSIVGQSAKLREVLYMVDRLLDNAIPVLVTGESGTGKELIARAVHYNGARKNAEFVAVNCGSIPSSLFESELFGHMRGAFTGATGDKRGLFEVAHRGTLFLDEIGELPLEMQVKLLRVLQSGEIQKVGSTRSISVDVRIVAATNRDLKEEVRLKSFREDLYYRLNVVQLTLPALRDRIDDIPVLVQHFVQSNRAAGLTNVRSVSAESMALLARYHWPGNIRELDTVIKNASVFAEGDVLRPADFAHIPELVAVASGGRPTGAGPRDTSGIPVGLPLADLEREAIVRNLEAQGGNKKRTAEILGIDRRTLYNKLAAYQIEVQRSATIVESKK